MDAGFSTADLIRLIGQFQALEVMSLIWVKFCLQELNEFWVGWVCSMFEVSLKAPVSHSDVANLLALVVTLITLYLFDYSLTFIREVRPAWSQVNLVAYVNRYQASGMENGRSSMLYTSSLDIFP